MWLQERHTDYAKNRSRVVGQCKRLENSSSRFVADVSADATARTKLRTREVYGMCNWSEVRGTARLTATDGYDVRILKVSHVDGLA